MKDDAIQVGTQIDMRGFRHELEPLCRRTRWQLDALEARLGAAQREVSRARALLMQMKEEQARATGHAARSVQSRLDAAHHTRTLFYLANLQAKASALNLELTRLERARDVAHTACLRGQQRLDVLLTHRKEAMGAYATQAAQRQASDSDRDWLARLQWQTLTRPGMPYPEAA